MAERVEFDLWIGPSPADPELRCVLAAATNRVLLSPAFGSWPELEQWLLAEVPGYRLNAVVVRCDECGGRGLVTWPWDDPATESTVMVTEPCPACGGTGIDSAGHRGPEGL